MAHQVSPDNLESAAHEKDQVSVRGIVHFVIWFVIIAVIIHVAIWGVYRGILHYHEAQYAPTSALLAQQVAPPEPQLQPTKYRSESYGGHERLPWQDTQLMLRREDEEFRRRGWAVDENTHRVTMSADIIQQVKAITNGGSGTAPRTEAPPAQAGQPESTRPEPAHTTQQPAHQVTPEQTGGSK